MVGFVIWLAYFVIPHTIFSGLTNYYMPNYAKEIALPIETSLLRAGAVKVCENAANGREPSNMTPSYAANYQFSVSNEEAIDIIKRAANENGFSINPTPSNYESIHNYEDRTTKDSPYPDLEQGEVELIFSSYSNTADKGLSCRDGKALLGDSSHTAVSMSLVLPSFSSR